MKRLMLVMVFFAFLYACPTFASVPPFTLTTPAAYQVIQRDVATNTATITISGSVAFNPHIQSLVQLTHRLTASWGGTQQFYTVGQRFQITLDAVPVGQHTLVVTLDGASISVPYVSVGDIYIIAGQSNAVGAAIHLQRYTPYQGLQAFRFDRAFHWTLLRDPVDSPNAHGSYWPLLATDILANGIPVAFVPTARPSTSITEWQPTDPTNINTLFGAMSDRIARLSGDRTAPIFPLARAVLWHQGETDAANGMDTATYSAYLETFADAVWQRYQIPVLAVKLQHMTGRATPAHQADINAGIDDAIGADSHILPGADMRDIVATSADGVHLTTNLVLQSAADRWWAALVQNGFYTP